MNFLDIRNQFRDYCLIERGLTSKSYRTVTAHMQHLLDFLETENVREVTEQDVRDFLAKSKQEKSWSPKTVRAYLQSFRSFYKWCKLRGYVGKNPTKNIEKPKIPKRLPRCLTKEQAQTILAHTQNYQWISDFANARNIAIIYTFLFTGVRLNELLHIRYSDVCMETFEILIREGKGSKERIVPMHPKLHRILKKYFRQRQEKKKMSKWFFTGVNSDKRLYEKNIHQVCNQIVVSSGIKFYPHMLRHTFARLACDENINLFKLKEVLGHSEISTTQIYLSVSKKGMKESINRLELI